MAYLPSSSLVPDPSKNSPSGALLGQPQSLLSSGALQGLAELVAKLPRRGLYYVDKDIELDGLVFEECSLLVSHPNCLMWLVDTNKQEEKHTNPKGR